MQLTKTIADLREARKSLSGKIGLVPTMGALHTGHIALFEQAKVDNDTVVGTIFVNPTQFGPNEDFTVYPRDLESDLSKLRNASVDVVFTPTSELMYPKGFQTYIDVEDVSKGLEGAHRPGHFRGVATVVAKLFNLIQPTRAYFGQKDAQQVTVIRRMVYDLNFDLEVVVYPTVRESDGLAMSSRNRYLDQNQRKAAQILYKALQYSSNAYDRGERSPAALRRIMSATVEAESLAKIEYVSVADARTMQELESSSESPLLLSLAVKIGGTRLIDNCLLPMTLNTREALAATLGFPPIESL